MYLFGVILFVLYLKVHSFNFDTNNPIVFVDPLKHNEERTYFGYSIILYPGSDTREKWIKIGSPGGTNQNSKKNRTGVVYECPFLDICKEPTTFPFQSEPTTGSWIGGSMDISYKHNRTVICGFRWSIWSKKAAMDGLFGACYWTNLNKNTTTLTMPLNDPDKHVFAESNLVAFYLDGEAGVSAHFPEKENELLLGAPGVLNWAGTIIRFRDIELREPKPSRLTRERSLTRSTDEFGNINIANALSSPVRASFQLLGYALTSGYFFGDDELIYVSSAPKDYFHLGKIILFKFNDNHDEYLDVIESKIGMQFAEYFGASLAAGDINNDGCDDLIVGAPFHTLKTFNEGKVYIFWGSKGQLQQNVYKMDGISTNGQFGTSVMFLGDIDHDGYGDIAISAPYEQDSGGVLYIYKGTKQSELRFSQKIVGKDISQELMGFGISISRPIDLDGNGYKDIAVGAPISGHAVLLRSIPIAVLNGTFESLSLNLETNAKTLVLRACYEYTGYKGPFVDIERRIIVDEQLRRASLKNTNENKKRLFILKGKPNCENITLSIVKGTKNVIEPITASVTYKLAQHHPKKEVMYISTKEITGNNLFCPFCPILDTYRSLTFKTIKVPFSLGCATKICNSNLTVTTSFPSLREKNVFIVGSSDNLIIRNMIQNSGENAYVTKLEVLLPDALNFRETPSFCEVQNNVSLIICDVDNPLRNNETKIIDLDLDTKNLKNEKKINIYLRISTSSVNKNSDNAMVTLILKREAGIKISGNSGEQSYSYKNISHGKPSFSQIFMVDKLGISPVEKVRIDIKIPYALKTGEQFIQLFKPQGNFAGQPLICKSKFKYITEKEALMENLEMLPNHSSLKMKREAVEIFQNNSKIKDKSENVMNKEYENLPNRTFYINCTVNDVLCSSVICYSSFEKGQTPLATINIKMVLDISKLHGHLVPYSKDIILFSTTGSIAVEIPSDLVQNGNKSDIAVVSSLFIGESTVKAKVSLWIIILSVVVGLIVLSLIILGLIKAGFFKRAKKEKLKILKAQEENGESLPSVPEDFASEEMQAEDLLKST